MDKRLAHFVLLIFDGLSLWAFYHVIDKWHEVVQSINAGVSAIELQSPFGLYMVMLIMPIIHSQCLVKIKRKSVEKLRNYLVAGLFLFLLLSGFVFDYLIEKEVTNAGYQLCPSQSEALTFSTFKVYLNGESCL